MHVNEKIMTKPSGQISCRVDAQLQTTLYGIAEELNLDVSGLVKAMIAETLPGWKQKADGMRRRRWATTYRVEEAHVPLVHVAILAGVENRGKDQLRAMRLAVQDHNPELSAGEMQSVLVAAGKELAHFKIESDDWGLHHGPDEQAQFLARFKQQILARD